MQDFNEKVLTSPNNINTHLKVEHWFMKSNYILQRCSTWVILGFSLDYKPPNVPRIGPGCTFMHEITQKHKVIVA